MAKKFKVDFTVTFTASRVIEAANEDEAAADIKYEDEAEILIMDFDGQDHFQDVHKVTEVI